MKGRKFVDVANTIYFGRRVSPRRPPGMITHKTMRPSKKHSEERTDEILKHNSPPTRTHHTHTHTQAHTNEHTSLQISGRLEREKERERERKREKKKKGKGKN